MADPFSPSLDRLAAQMTHWPPQPNPAEPYLSAVSNFAGGGLQRALGLPNSWLGRVLQNPDNLAAMGMATPMRSFRAFHGSPHDFERFDMAKIGTGEGAQAYGRGLYFAENPAVAEDYKRVLAAKAGMSGANRIDAEAQKWINQHGGIEQAKTAIDEEIKRWADSKTTVEYLQLVKDAMKPPNPGHMYQVAINADREHLLDWDKPLNQQSEYVTNALRSIVKDVNRMPADWIKSSPGAEQRLLEAGIPGIRYLDQGSRAGGTSTRNYVVFNDQIIDIIKKYGIAGLIAAGAYHQQEGQ